MIPLSTTNEGEKSNSSTETESQSAPSLDNIREILDSIYKRIGVVDNLCYV